MKRSKRLLGLLGILAIVCIATFAVSRYEEQQEQIRSSREILLQLSPDSVTGISWCYSSGDGFAFSKSDGIWQYTQDPAFPVEQSKITDIVGHFENYAVSFVIDNVADYSQYGLDQPECTLCLESEDGNYTIKIGDFSKIDDQRYIDVGDGKVYLVEEDPADYIYSALSSLIRHDDTPGFESVVDITFTGSQNYTITRRDNCIYTYAPEQDIYFVEENGKTVPLNTSYIRTYLNAITSLSLTDYVTYNATAEDLAAFGLDSPILSVSVRYSHTDEDKNTLSDTCVIHIGENVQERAESDAAVSEGSSATSVTKYVRIGDSPIIYKLSDYSYNLLTSVDYNDLRHKELFWGDWETVTQIDVRLEDQTHTFFRKDIHSDTQDDEELWYWKDTQTDMQSIQTALYALTAHTFSDSPPEGKVEICLTLHLSDENFSTVELCLYRYDGTSCLATLDGETIGLLSRSAVMDLVESIQAIVLGDL